MNFKLTDRGVIRIDDGAHIPDNPSNSNWQEYQKWVDEGNVPLPADPPPPSEPNPNGEIDAALAALDPATATVGDLIAVLRGQTGKKGRIAGRPI